MKQLSKKEMKSLNGGLTRKQICEAACNAGGFICRLRFPAAICGLGAAGCKFAVCRNL